ncbi:hypothetical protein Q1695_007232 [Nippostrongylus brasiliensis]|nr:hypothetical protein Q1695_007232 [Nippostrongylus brasiliensis]
MFIAVCLFLLLNAAQVKPAKCPDLKTPSGATVKVGNGIAKLTCNGADTYPTGATELQCRNGKWTPAQFGKCVKMKSCFASQALFAYTGGSVKFSSNVTNRRVKPLTVATITCSESKKQHKLVCGKNGWSPALRSVKCEQSSCVLHRAPYYGQLQISSGIYGAGGMLWWQNRVASNTVVTVSCKHSNGTKQAKCVNGKWTPFWPRLNCSEVINKCSAFRAPYGTKVQYSDKLYTFWKVMNNTEATVSCVNGKEKHTLKCVNKWWQPSPYSLRLMKCGAKPSEVTCRMPYIAYAGIMEFSKEIVYNTRGTKFSTGSLTNGTVASIICPGRKGVIKSVCANGAWNPRLTLYECLLSRCLVRRIPPNVRVTLSDGLLREDSVAGDTKATVTCANSTAKLELECRGGKWTPAWNKIYKLC